MKGDFIRLLCQFRCIKNRKAKFDKEFEVRKRSLNIYTHLCIYMSFFFDLKLNRKLKTDKEFEFREPFKYFIRYVMPPASMWLVLIPSWNARHVTSELRFLAAFLPLNKTFSLNFFAFCCVIQTCKIVINMGPHACLSLILCDVADRASYQSRDHLTRNSVEHCNKYWQIFHSCTCVCPVDISSLNVSRKIITICESFQDHCQLMVLSHLIESQHKPLFYIAYQ